MFKTVASSFVVAVTEASLQETAPVELWEQEHPMVQAAWNDNWAYVDFAFGLLINSYEVLQANTNTGTCFATMFGLGLKTVDWSKDFNKPIPTNDWFAQAKWYYS